MSVPYNTLFFLAGFFLFFILAVIFVLPLVISLLLSLILPDGCNIVGSWSVVVSICTSIAVLTFSIALLTLSVFSWIPWYVASILISLFLLLVIAALRPWKRDNWMPSFFIMIALIIFILVISWPGAWLSKDVCVASSPYTINFYIFRRNKDSCAKTAPRPCHTYLTYGEDASTQINVMFHSTKVYNSPNVLIGSVPGVYTTTVAATRFKIEIEVDRYVYYASVSGLTPGTTYYLVLGDGTNPLTDNPNTWITEKKFRTAPTVGPFRFAAGGDTSVTNAAKKMIADAASVEPLYILIGGDIAYENSIKSCYWRLDDWFDMYEQNAVTPTGYTVPLITAVGNHENGGWGFSRGHMKFYNRYFIYTPLNGTNPKDQTLHHRHRIVNQELLVLDSGVLETPADQTSYITSVLEPLVGVPNIYRTATYHAPAYPSVRPMSNAQCKAVRDNFIPLFDQYGLATAFENHDHAYKRTHLIKNNQIDSNGTLYLGDGAMGVTARPPINLAGKPLIAASSGTQFWIFVTVSTNSASYSMRDINNSEFDSFTHTWV